MVRSLNSEKLPHGGEISWGRKGPTEDQRRIQQTICGRQDTVRTAHMVYTAALCIHSNLSHESPVAKGVWLLESVVWSGDPRRGLMLAVKR